MHPHVQGSFKFSQEYRILLHKGHISSEGKAKPHLEEDAMDMTHYY